MQVPKHVASREAGEDQVFRIRFGRVSTEFGVVRAFDGRLTRRDDAPSSIVAPIVLGPLTTVARPNNHSREVMGFGHAHPLWYTCIHVYIISRPRANLKDLTMTPETIAIELRTELMAGVLRPGAELSQVELAERFGVS